MKLLSTLAPTLALAVTTLFGATAAGAAGADTYVAVPTAPSAKASFITRSTVWRAREGGFVAGQAPERPAVLWPDREARGGGARRHRLRRRTARQVQRQGQEGVRCREDAPIRVFPAHR